MKELYNAIFYAVWHTKDSGYTINDIERWTKFFNGKILFLLSNPRNKVSFLDTGEYIRIGDFIDSVNDYDINYWYKKFRNQPDNTILGLIFYDQFLKDLKLPDDMDFSQDEIKRIF